MLVAHSKMLYASPVWTLKTNQEAQAGGEYMQMAGAVEPHDDGGVDTEIDSGYPNLGESIKALKYVIFHCSSDFGTWMLPAQLVEKEI